MAELDLTKINTLVKNSPVEAIRMAEIEYHSRIGEIARRITDDERIKIVLLAGPSGSGKTTSANLICDAIETQGEAAMVVSLDNFYRDCSDPDYPRAPDGELDYECPEALKLDEISEVLQKIADNQPYDIPRYDFKKGACVEIQHYPPINRGCVIIEGLHALNPRIREKLADESLLKIFISVSTNINHGGERILSGRKARFIRRLVRDSIYRGSDAERTLDMWEEVLAAEDVYLYPYKATADLAFNTFHIFELSAMKPFVERLISDGLAEKSEYASTVLSAIKKVVPLDYNLIPQNSLIREFIPGGIYEDLY